MEGLEPDVPVPLGQLLHRDRELVKEVCQGYVDLYGVSVKLLDDRGHRVIEVAGPAALCQYVFEIPRCRAACLEIVRTIRERPSEFRQTDTHVCFSGAEYRCVPVHQGTDVVGKVVFGPFLPVDVEEPPSQFLEMDPTVQAEPAWEATRQFQSLDRETARRVAEHLANVIEVVCFVSLKGQMTTDMHVQSISEAYDELMRKNTELEEKVWQLARLDRQRSALIGAIGNELATPLRNMIGYAEMLLEGLGVSASDDQRDFLHMIVDQGEQALDDAESLDELSRILRGDVRVAMHTVAPDALLREVFEQHHAQAERKEISLVLDLADELPSTEMDSDKMRRVLGNLVDHAIHHTPSGGQVTLAAAIEPVRGTRNGDCDYLTLTVRDTGRGIPEEQQDHLFDPFYSVGTDIHRTQRGSGVGLSIAQGYARALGGHIRVDSAPGLGTALSVMLPLKRGAAPAVSDT